MRQRILIVLIFSLAVVWIAGCGGKYSDAVKVNEEFAELTEEYINALEKADNAKAVAKAMNQFSDGFEKLAPRMREISEKYPELKDESNNPKEFQESKRKAEEVGKQFGGTFMKVMPYMKDPEVRAAQKRMSEVMQLMRGK